MPWRVRLRGIWKWLLPDLAAGVAWVTLFYSLFLFQGYRKFFRDSDAGWHIRTGETILHTGQLPRTDPYSFPRAGTPWFAWEWAADVATGAVHQLDGLTGVAFFYATAIAAGVWLWFRLHWAMGGDFLLACGLSPLLLSTCNLHWLARPHVIGWLFLLAAIWFAEQPHRRFGWRDGILVVAFTALWANVHASFVLAPLLAALYAAGVAAGRVLWPAEDRHLRTLSGWYLRAAAVALAAGLINPYGFGLYRHVVNYLSDSELLGRIGEFQSFDFHSAGAGQIEATLLIGIAGGALALVRRRPEHFLLTVFFSAAALRSARGLPLAALVLLPIANGASRELLSKANGLAQPVRRAIDAFLAYSGALRAWDRGFRGWLATPLVLAACWAILQSPAVRARTGFAPDQFPVAAYSHLPENARLFAPDKFGGYLIYRSAGSRKVFFDGRSDLYGAEFLKQYGRLVQARPGWQEIWNRYGFTCALLPIDTPLRTALEQAGWRVVYRDSTVTLLSGGGA